MKLNFWPFNRSDSNSESAPTSKSNLPAKFAAIATVGAIAAIPLTITEEYNIRLVTKGGKIVDTLDPGFGYVIPLYQSTYDLRGDSIEISPPAGSVGFQNGNVTAKDIKSTAYIRLTGTRAQKEETVKMIFRDMRDFDPRIKSLAESAMRDVVRQTILPASDEGVAKPDVKAAAAPASAPTGKPETRVSFLDSQTVGTLIAQSLQASIDKIIPGTINVGTPEQPEMVSRIQVTRYAINNFEWDDVYKEQRKQIQDGRTKAETAKYAEQQAIRTADAMRATARGDKDAQILRGEGAASAAFAMKKAEADGLLELETAQATGMGKRIASAGGVDKLTQILNAQNWNGSYATTVGAGAVITDTRGGNRADVIPVPTPAPPAQRPR